MTESSNHINEELLSAYLDGELSAEQQQQVDQLLRDDEDARHALDEMQSLRETLQSLPRQQLDENFAHRVLSAAERRMLTKSASDRGAGPPQSKSSDTNWRRYLWAGAALAAGLLIMFLNTGDVKERSVALLSESEPLDAELDAVDELAARAPADDERIMYKGGHLRPTVRSDEPADGSNLEEAIAGRESRVADKKMDEAGAGLGGLGLGGLAEFKSLPNEVAEADMSDVASGDLASGDLASGDLASGDLASGDLASGDLASGDLASGTGEAADTAKDDNQWFVRVAAEAVDSDLVVQLQLRGLSTDTVAFDQVLAKNSIAISPDNLELVEQAEGAIPQVVIAEPSRSIDADQSAGNKMPNQQPHLTSEYQLVFVEASPEQIVEATRELEENTSDFQQVRIESRRGETSQSQIDLAATRELVQKRRNAPQPGRFARSAEGQRNRAQLSKAAQPAGSYAQRIDVRRGESLYRMQQEESKLAVRDRLKSKYFADEDLQEAETYQFSTGLGMATTAEGNLRVLFVLHTLSANGMKNDINGDRSVPSSPASESASELPADTEP